ncbi:MAG: hypothetical protein MUC43_07290 [Pirellula sp.]|nr:hypothetical protein [Pirellula sp.]
MFVTTWSLLTFACFFVVLPSVGKDEVLSAAPINQWPSTTKVSLGDSTQHLVVFVHPFCPCTRATLRNLDEALRDSDLKVSVVQLRNEKLESSHAPISHIADLSRKNGWNLILDDNGVEARAFGAMTSGECMLFSSSGERLFIGGVTASRGHLGNNEGLDVLKGIVHRITTENRESAESGVQSLARSATTTTKNRESAETHDKIRRVKESICPQFPTFGCPLFTETGCGRESTTCQLNAN